MKRSISSFILALFCACEDPDQLDDVLEDEDSIVAPLDPSERRVTCEGTGSPGSLVLKCSANEGDWECKQVGVDTWTCYSGKFVWTTDCPGCTDNPVLRPNTPKLGTK